MYLALVSLFVVYRKTSGTNGTCVCRDNNGGVYNLQPLQRTDGNPRFTEEGRGEMSGYEYAYNPCASFVINAPLLHPNDCLDDVAICRRPQNGASFTKIGDQSTAHCGEPTRMQLIYKTKGYPGEEWHYKVTLICNRTKETPSFEQDPDDSYQFFLTHKCACPNACPLDPTTTTPASTSASQDDGKALWEPLSIAVGSVLFVILVIFAIFCLVATPPNRNDHGERRHLFNDQDSGIDESRNSFPDSTLGRRIANLLNDSLPVSKISSSNNDIKTPPKNILKKTERSNVAV